MSDNHIVLRGIKKRKDFVSTVSAELVDIAYAEPIDEGIKVSMENEIDLKNEEDLNWILDILIQKLRELGEEDYETEIRISEK